MFSSRCGLVRFLAAALILLKFAGAVDAQGIANASSRPFVVAIIPVIGPNGAVGGVSVDTKGALSRAGLDTQGKLKQVRVDAMHAVPDALVRPSRLRKISLKALNATLAKHAASRKPLPDEVNYLAGLIQVQYVLAYPDQQDIVLAGPAEGWQIANDGAVVGRITGRPVVQLQDLLVAFRSAADSGQELISCSIDPTPEGVERMRQMTTRRGFQFSRQSVAQLERALGSQVITLTGVPDSTRFSRVMVAADFMMKRLAMGLEKAPTGVDLESYLQLVAKTREQPAAMPRWWLAPKYGAVLHDEERLAWQLKGATVVAKTDEPAQRETAHRTTAQWADNMTKQYESLSRSMPVFADLRNCMDLAVVGALVQWQDLEGVVGADFNMLLGDAIQPAPLNVPRTVGSQASLVRQGRSWIVSVSGGVQVDAWAPLESTAPSADVGKVRAAAVRKGQTWWWD